MFYLQFLFKFLKYCEIEKHLSEMYKSLLFEEMCCVYLCICQCKLKQNY